MGADEHVQRSFVEIYVSPHRDRFGRLWLKVDDEMARRLVAWKRETWTEIPDVGHGHSRTVRSAEDAPVIWPLLDRLHELCEVHGDHGAFIAGRSYPHDSRHGEFVPDLLVSTCGVSGARDRGYSLEG